MYYWLLRACLCREPFEAGRLSDECLARTLWSSFLQSEVCVSWRHNTDWCKVGCNQAHTTVNRGVRMLASMHKQLATWHCFSSSSYSCTTASSSLCRNRLHVVDRAFQTIRNVSLFAATPLVCQNADTTDMHAHHTHHIHTTHPHTHIHTPHTTHHCTCSLLIVISVGVGGLEWTVMTVVHLHSQSHWVGLTSISLISTAEWYHI